MLLYVNGDSHAAGAEINSKLSFSGFRDSRVPHPDNVVKSFGYLLAEKLNYEFVIDAESGASNDRILRTTKEYLKNNDQDIFVLIGWSTTNRKEFLVNGEYHSFAPGFQSDIPVLKEKFKEYILSLDRKTMIDLNYYWHEKIYNFHRELAQKNIPHLFFNTFEVFNHDIHPTQEKIFYDWNHQMIGPYKDSETYYSWLKNNGFSTVTPNTYHYGADAHAAWADRLYRWLTHYKLCNILNA